MQLVSFRQRLFISVLVLVAASAALPCSAALSLYLAPEALAARAPLVVRATVARTASGFDPRSSALRTYVTLDVLEVLRGPRDLERVVVREAGGRFGRLSHDVDAVPHYEPGETVIAFLEPAADGALRTSGMFFGKFRVAADGPDATTRAVRDLEGRGRILGRNLTTPETLDLDELRALVALAPRRDRGSTTWRAAPAEYGRLAWDAVREAQGSRSAVSSPTAADFARAGLSGAHAEFVPMSAALPARWAESDSGVAIPVHVQTAGNPLGDASAAVAQVHRALSAWTDVAESRVALQPGNMDFDYAGNYSASPATAFAGINVVLFDDPYDDISNGSGCGGVLAIGGYWKTSAATTTVNNVQFETILSLYAILNDDFECFLGDADDLAEVVTHELGHGLGFGHSAAPDSIMRSTVYGGGRGPDLGLDDRDAAHCHYPHTLELVGPATGDVWVAGSYHSVEWSASAEAGPDPGTVDIEISHDEGQTWESLAAAEPNDGSYGWTVGEQADTTLELRLVRQPAGDWAPAAFSGACSASAASGPVSVASDPHARWTRRLNESSALRDERAASLPRSRGPRGRDTAPGAAPAP